MPANPYVTVPAGRASQQALWVQAYYRNLALQNQYDQQPDLADAFGQGIGQGLGAGVGQYLGVLDQNAKFQQANNLQAQQDSAAADRQHAAIEQSNALQAQREQAQAEAEQRKAILAQVLAQQQQRNLGMARQQFYGGMGPVAVAQPDKVMPPVDYNDTSQAYPQPPTYMTPPVQDVLSGMDPSLAGLITPQDIETAGKQPKGGWDEAALARLKYAHEIAGTEPDLSQDLAASTPAGRRPLIPKPPEAPKPIPMPFTDTQNAWLARKGYTRESFAQLPQERQDAILGALDAYTDTRAAALKKQEVEAAATIADTKARSEQADQAQRDFTTIRTILPEITAKAAQLLQPGVAGKATGLAKERMQAWFGTYPEVQELVSMGESIKGAITRRVLLEVGMLTDIDVRRADALIPKATDNLETGMAKARVLSVYMDAATQAWEAYRSSGLLGSGRPAQRPISDFLPQGFWEQSRRLTPPKPGGPWKEVGG